MARPFQRISPASGGSRPISMRSRLVLPAPFLPCRYSSSPASSVKPRPANRRRSPRTHSRLSASSIQEKTEKNQVQIMDAQVYRQIDDHQTKKQPRKTWGLPTGVHAEVGGV